MDSEYDYTISPVAVDALTQQIQQSSIITALDYINALGSSVSIFFKAALSTEDKATLDTVIAAHNGVPLVQNQVQNVNVTNSPIVTTQFETGDKVLTLTRGKGDVDSSCTATIYIQVPGTFGSGQGRYVIGGYGISSDWNPDDYATCYVTDKDRLIALMVAQAITPGATAPVSDATIQGMGVISGIGQAFPNYPILESYTDSQQPTANQGWYFWPLVTSSTTPPVGEVEINPIAGYGFIPAGFYVQIVYNRPSGVTTGTLRVNIDWGMKIS